MKNLNYQLKHPKNCFNEQNEDYPDKYKFPVNSENEKIKKNNCILRTLRRHKSNRSKISITFK